MATAPDTQAPSYQPLPVTLADEQLEQLAGLVAAAILDKLPSRDQKLTGLSSAEAADYLGLSVETLRDEVAARKIVSHQNAVGGPHRFDIADLDAYRFKHRKPAVN